MDMYNWRKTLLIMTALPLLIALNTGCGQTGDLYLPQDDDVKDQTKK